ncbi:MAG: hypothetical protein COT84_00755 [Chlamydiae bacterium CG10_big_fil_rev_8_21_14_0_10_35_9]|nr:MAG: hypothetical protein COT84_00755 [Chlamydiae bacterium CG10_big_fil_rev_8_21_14_0_10_35_9]
MSKEEQIYLKTHRILKGIFIINFILLFRIWHLCFYEKEEKALEARRPQRKTILLKSERGAIHDRFGVPLAINRICYNAAIYYGQILQIPRVKWIKGENKEKVKTYPRKEYIEKLSKLLAKELNLNETRVDDLIHSKASLFPHMPFILKENISEKTYYKLKFLEKDWPGLFAESTSERYYPHKKAASKIIGYMGSINKKEYLKIANEIKFLENVLKQDSNLEPIFLPEEYKSKFEVLTRLKQLKEKSYRFNDLVGKSGIEKQFEEDLRGSYGEKSMEVDIMGTFVKELPLTKPAIDGRNIKLALSVELQEFAEKLLAQDEQIREGRSTRYNAKLKKRETLKQPIVKGGSVVAMDPNTGEIIAMASYPNYDPNDFIPSTNPLYQEQKKQNVEKWLETESFLASIWDGKNELEKSWYSFSKKTFEKESIPVTWEFFLQEIFPESSPCYQCMQKIKTVQNAIQLQEDIEAIFYFFKTKNAPLIFDTIFSEGILCEQKASLAEKENYQNIYQIIKERIAPYEERLKDFLQEVKHNKDKLLIIDLCKIAVFSPAFSDGLIRQIKTLSLSDYHNQSRNVLVLQSAIYKKAYTLFEKYYFEKWREENLHAFLKEKRKEEKEKNTYQRPYIDYLDEKKNSLFEAFWQENKEKLLLTALGNTEIDLEKDMKDQFLQWKELFQEQTFHDKKCQKAYDELKLFLKDYNQPTQFAFFKSVRSFKELTRPLLAMYRKVYKENPVEKDLAAKFYPEDGYGYMRDTSFQEPALQGSIFKLVTAYAALEKKPSFDFTIIDTVQADNKGLIVALKENQQPFYRIYKHGRLPRSAHSNIGTVSLIDAIEKSSNPYFSILAGDFLKTPEDLNYAARNFGFGEKTHIQLPGEISGSLPSDLSTNKTGLYAYAIGHHTLIVTPLQTAVFLSALANFGKVLEPKIIQQIAGKQRAPHLSFSPEKYLLQKELNALGIFFPIFDESSYNDKFLCVQNFSSFIRKDLAIDKNVRAKLFEGMKRVISGKKGTARAGIIKNLYKSPDLMKNYKEIASQLIGKTSTAEVFHNPYISAKERSKLYKHIWFGGICFDPTKQSQVSIDSFKYPELVVIVYLRFGDAGKEAAPIASEVIKKYRELKKKYRPQVPELKEASSSSI